MKELYTLFKVIQERKSNPVENSYTSYLFNKGLDKILKKCGEECSEVIIAAKSLESAIRESAYLSNSNSSIVLSEKQSDLENELVDLIYHMLVLLAFYDIPLCNIEQVLMERSKKIGNLKTSASPVSPER